MYFEELGVWHRCILSAVLLAGLLVTGDPTWVRTLIGIATKQRAKELEHKGRNLCTKAGFMHIR